MIDFFNSYIVQIDILIINRVIAVLKMKYLKSYFVKVFIGINFKYFIS